jgi:hypothetical protein
LKDLNNNINNTIVNLVDKRKSYKNNNDLFKILIVDKPFIIYLKGEENIFLSKIFKDYC